MLALLHWHNVRLTLTRACNGSCDGNDTPPEEWRHCSPRGQIRDPDASCFPYLFNVVLLYVAHITSWQGLRCLKEYVIQEGASSEYHMMITDPQAAISSRARPWEGGQPTEASCVLEKTGGSGSDT